ncbi:hypothetical protein [Paenirhodobacter sp.]|uniref:hypothetical protein n=1 Tax=Paenirhodobacter sp. TaxID=1965326 RepID=UPI003B40ECBA
MIKLSGRQRGQETDRRGVHIGSGKGDAHHRSGPRIGPVAAPAIPVAELHARLAGLWRGMAAARMGSVRAMTCPASGSASTPTKTRSSSRPPFAPGMVFSIEPMLCVYGECGVRLEGIVHMTQAGPRWFCPPAGRIDAPFE